jgi:hypothetical protein
MPDGTVGQRLASLYVRRAALFGVLWCIVPTLIAWAVALSGSLSFRPVYLLRFAVTALVGGALGALANRHGVALWLMKDRSPQGPATVLDGAAIGAAVGWITGLVGPLASFIGTEHVEDAKTVVIVGWLAAAAMGTIAGALLARLWRREFPSGGPAPRPHAEGRVHAA